MTFLSAAFYAAVDDVRVKRNMLWKEVGAEANIAPSTFVRLRSPDNKPDIDTVAKLLVWANLEANTFFTSPNGPVRSLPTIMAAIQQDPELTDSMKNIIEAVTTVLYQLLT